MISAHEYTLSVAGERLPIKDGRVTLDEGWSPYAQATVTLALPDARVLAALDPRKGGRGRLTLAARYGTPTPTSRVTDLFAGRALSEVTKGKILRRNIVPNPSFEASTSGVLLGAGIASVELGSWSGQRFLRVIGGPTPGSGNCNITQNVYGISGGDWVAFCPRAGAGSGVSHARLIIGWYSAVGYMTQTGGPLVELPAAPIIDDASKLPPLAAQAPPGAVRAQLTVQWSQAGGAAPAPGFVTNTEKWLGAVAGSESDALQAVASYMDGATTDTADRLYEWEGTPHASPSVERDPTTAWGGLSLRAITASLSTPYNAAGHRDSSIRELDLAVVERTINRKDATVTLELTSDETYLQDYRSTTPMSPGTWTARAAVELALAQIGATLQPGTANGAVSGESTVWEVGTSAWDYAHSLVDAAGLRLWCDEQRRWWLTEPLNPDSAPNVYVVQPQTSQELDEILSREEWASGVIVTYEWETAAGRQTMHDVAGWGPRHLQLRVARPYPGAGAAAAILARVRARGSLVRARSVSTYDVTPGWVMQSLATDTAHLAGLVSTVAWNLDSDEVEVASRDLSDTPPHAWIMQPAGHRWTDVPVGMTWQTYNTPDWSLTWQ